MKIRCDFVTNSSSSSFILARKGGLSDRQKEAIIRLVERNYLGRPLLESGDSEQEIEDVFDRGWFHDGRITKEKIKKLLADGFNIYVGRVDFEEAEYEIAEMYGDFWDALTENQDGEHAVEVLDGSLDY